MYHQPGLQRRSVQYSLLGFSKASDKVSHQRLVKKLGSHGGKERVVTCIRLIKTQETGEDGSSVCMVRVRETPQGPMLFSLFTNVEKRVSEL